MDIREMRTSVGLSQREFAQLFSVPVRTLQQWEQEKSSPAPYVLSMIERLLPTAVPEKNSPEFPQYALPHKDRWNVCIPQPFENCERIYPIQQAKVKRLLDDITADPAVLSVSIFGSSTTEKCHMGSDVDVYVEMTENHSPIRKTHDFTYDLWTNFTANKRLQEEIRKKGVCVYGNSEHAL